MDRRALLAAAESPHPLPAAHADEDPTQPTPIGGSAAAAAEQPPESGPQLNVGHYLILISLNSIGAFSSDCYIPNLSDVAKDLHATDAEVSLTIQINWYLLGLATPIVGHLSDIYGRKIVVCLTLVVYVVGAVGSAIAPTIGWLLAARCVQGVGESVSIITSAIIRDVVEDKQARMRVQAYFTTMRPLMLLGGPSIGGFIGTAFGWRNLMKGLSVWGGLTICLMYFIPETNAAHLPPRRSAASSPATATTTNAALAAADDAAPPKPQRRQGRCAGLGWEQFRRMGTNADFLGLTVSAAICMGAVRAMLSNISFVYTHYYKLSTTIGGLLISVPPLTGFVSSLLAARAASRTRPALLVRVGMAAGVLPPALMLLSAGMPQLHPCPSWIQCLYARPRWYMTTIPCALLSAVGFFALPAMQVLVLQDFRDMSGLAGGMSKLFMTLASTGASELVSYYFSDWGKDGREQPHAHMAIEDGLSELVAATYLPRPLPPPPSVPSPPIEPSQPTEPPPPWGPPSPYYTHFHTQRLLYALATILIVLQLWFWLVYIPIKRCERARHRAGALPMALPTHAHHHAPS